MTRKHCDNCDRVMQADGTPARRLLTLRNGDRVTVEISVVNPVTERRFELCDECRDELIARAESLVTR